MAKTSIAIIGEGETEWFYFDGLRRDRRFPFKVAPDFPQHADMPHMLKLAERYLSEGYDYVVCLIDMDRLNQNSIEMQTYQRLKQRYGKRVLFIETGPCSEFWFLLHFIPAPAIRLFANYDQLLPELQKYLPGYEKTKRYFRQHDIYRTLIETGNLQQAMSNAESLCTLKEEHPDYVVAYSQMHEVLRLLESMV